MSRVWLVQRSRLQSCNVLGVVGAATKTTETTVPADKFLISPITGEKISADKIQEHMRIGLYIGNYLLYA